MDLKSLLKNEFTEIDDAFLEKEGTLTFLRIKTNLTNMKDIEMISSKISDFLDKKDPIKEEYYLDVFSKGIEYEFGFDELDNELNKHIQIWFNENNFILGQLLENKETSIILKTNKRGLIRKEEFLKEKIVKMNTYVKV